MYASGEYFHSTLWTSAVRIGLDSIRDEIGNIFTIKEFARDRSVLANEFPDAVFITENFKLTTKVLSGLRSQQ